MKKISITGELSGFALYGEKVYGYYFR